MKTLRKLWVDYLKNKEVLSDKVDLLKALDDKGMHKEIEGYLRETWQSTELKNDLAPSNEDLNLFEKIDIQIRENSQKKPRLVTLYWVQAACVAGLLGLSMWLLNGYDSESRAITKVEIEAGEKANSVSLPDGSTVWLNSASSLSYDNDYLTSRKIILEGEAYFEVAKSESLPFRVRFGLTELIVTSTQFNVKYYNNETKSEVHVKEGSVSVYDDKDTSHLVENNLLIIQNITRQHTVLEKGFSLTNAWMIQKLIFDNTPMDEVFHSVERHFNVTIKADNVDYKSTSPITASYPKGTKLEEVLTGLSYLQDFEYKFINDDTIKVEF